MTSSAPSARFSTTASTRVSDWAPLARLFRRVHASLEAGGSLLFDIVTTRADRHGHAAREGRDWAILVRWHTDLARRRLTREMTVFRRVGRAWRRRREVHVQHLFEAATVERTLRESGFKVRRLRRYRRRLAASGSIRFPGHEALLIPSAQGRPET